MKKRIVVLWISTMLTTVFGGDGLVVRLDESSGATAFRVQNAATNDVMVVYSDGSCLFPTGTPPPLLEKDSLFTNSPSFGITSDDVTDWNEMAGWGDHALAGYATGTPVYAETDPVWSADKGDFATTNWVVAQSYVTSAPSNGITYTRRDGTWQFAEVSRGGFKIRVGTGGDFPSINAALSNIISNYVPTYQSGGYTCEIQLVSGFVMTEQVYVVDMDLGWITITAEDASVPIDRSYITNKVENIGPAAFCAIRGMTPTINALFGFTEGASETVYGLLACYNARGIVLPNAGFTNATYGIVAAHCSLVDAQYANVTHAKHSGMISQNASMLNATGANASYAHTYGFFAMNNAMINAHYAVASNVNTYTSAAGIYAYDGSTINAQGARVSGSTYGILARESATVAAPYVQARNCEIRGMYALYGSMIDGQYSDSTGAGGSGGYDISLSYGCYICSVYATGDVTQTKNTLTPPNGVIFRQ